MCILNLGVVCLSLVKEVFVIISSLQGSTLTNLKIKSFKNNRLSVCSLVVVVADSSWHGSCNVKVEPKLKVTKNVYS